MFVYNRYIKEKEEVSNMDYLLSRRTQDLIIMRNNIIMNSFFSEYENENMIPKMKERIRIEYSHPDEEWIYHRLLEEAIMIMRIIEYKNTCFFRYQNALEKDRNKFPKIEKMILEQIRTSKKTKYIDILELNPDLDIETVLEHMIDERIIEAVNNSKENAWDGTWGLLISPKQKWIINEEST